MASVIIIALKFIITVVLVVWISLLANGIAIKYGVDNLARCLNLEKGIFVLLALVPGVLVRLPYGKYALFLYYLFFVLVCVTTTICTVISAVESVIQDVPEKYHSWRPAFFAGYCMLGCLITLFFAGGNYMMGNADVILASNTLMTLVCVLAMNVAVTYVYPIARFYTDYYFSYGVRPATVYCMLWRSCPIFIASSFVIVIRKYRLAFLTAELSTTSTDIFETITFFVYVPAIVGIVLKIAHSVYGHKTKMILDANPEWGPYGEGAKCKRSHFNPQRDLKYLSWKPKCKHKCILLSKLYAVEVKEHLQKLKEVLEELRLHQKLEQEERIRRQQEQ